ncbi:MAG: methyltransferase domain-containing protein [Burkholderiaceae bacterium]
MKTGPVSGPAEGVGGSPDSPSLGVIGTDHEAARRREEIRRRSIARYALRAHQYDQSCGRTWSIRETAVANLGLQPGDRVLDVGCGTGLSFALLRDAVGDTGMVYGVEQSPDMAAQALARISREGWRNVQLFESSADRLRLPEQVDALLFNYTHDICQCPDSLASLFALAREDARISLAGVKYLPWWAGPVNLYVYFKNAAYNGAPGGLWRPWRHVLKWVPDLELSSAQYGMAYLGHGRLRHRAGGADRG